MKRLLWLATALAGCSKKVPPTAAATEVRGLVQDTKRYAESLQGQPAGDRIAPEQVAKLTSLLEQLLWTVVFGDFVTIYVALLNGVNPAPVDLVEKFKKELG